MNEQRSFFESLIKSGIHWGHQKSRRNPKMDPYIWGSKNSVSLIDVSKTAQALEQAASFLESIAAQGKAVLWVGTKKPAQEIIESVSAHLSMPSVTHRWIGGTLSNYSHVMKSRTKLLHFEDVLARAEKFPYYTKKELNKIQKSVDRLKKNVGGLRNLAWPVGAIVIIDINKERSAVKEAVRMGVPIVALVDTNADPSLIDFVIPGNDDAPRAIKLVIDYLGQAVARGAEVAKTKPVEKAVAGTPEQVDVTFIEMEEEEEEGDKRSTGRKVEAGAAAGKPGIRKKYEDDRSGRGMQKPVRRTGARPTKKVS